MTTIATEPTPGAADPEVQGLPGAPWPPSRLKVIAALGAVYLIWGSTYLGLRFALESFPPFAMGGVRYLLAGLALCLVLRWRGAAWPRLREWRSATLVGTLLFALGNGLVAYAEQSITSGVAAVVVATTPLWAVLFATLFGARPTWRELAGLVLGLLGVALLQRGGAFTVARAGFAIVVAPIAWALGSVLAPRLTRSAGPMAAATQMITGGLVMLLIGVARGERVGTMTPLAIGAFVYLVVFGSLVAFSAYHFLLSATRPALATSYAFVNPVVALLLGALLADDEPLIPSQALACGLTALAVLFVLRSRNTPQLGPDARRT